MFPRRFGCTSVRRWMHFAAATFGMVWAFNLHAGEYLLRTWQTDEGLPQNSVQSIHQTSDGYLWVGTQARLARFDGVQFKIFNPSATPEVRDRWFSALKQGRDGAFWIGTDGKGLLKLKDGALTIFSRTNGLVSDSVRTLCETTDGALWIGTGAGLSRYENGKFAGYTTAEGLIHPVVRAICEDRNRDIWVATGGGLQKFGGGDFSSSEIYQLRDGLPSPSLRCLLTAEDGTLWIGSNGGLTRYKDGLFTTFTTKHGLLDSTVSALWIDSQKNLWVGTYGGLHRFVDGRLIPEKTDTGVIFDAVYSIFEDREGNLWIGTNAGLLQLKQRRFVSVTKQTGLSHNSTVSVCQDVNGSIWVGTWGGALNEFRDGKITVHPASEVLPFHFVLALHPARDGALWFGTDYDGGLYRRTPDGGISRWGKEHGFSDPAISVIHEDRAGTVWVGTRTALVRFADGKFTNLTTVDGLPANSIKALAEDAEGALWIGTANGLAVRRADGEIKVFGAEHGLSNAAIAALHFDREGVLWIGTRGGGLNRLRNGVFTSYTTEQGLFSDDVFEIIEHDQSLWMTCSRGVFRVSRQSIDELDRGLAGSLHCISYDKSDGMASVDCKGVAKPAAWKAADGRLWFATGKGLVVTEAGIEINRHVPPVHVQEVLFDKETAGTDSTDLPITEISIPPGRGDLQIAYTALSLAAPEKNRFKYKLDGIDSDWVDAGARRTAYYNNLAPGAYRFRVVACNNDRVWNDIGAEVAVTLRPHFWQTWWCKAAAFLVCIGGLVGAYQIRISRFRDIEKLRIRIAGDLHDEVGSSLWSISLLSRMLHKSSGLTEEDRRDAQEINRIAMQTANSIRDIVWFINPEYDTVQDLLLRMRDVAHTMLNGIDHRLQFPQENLLRKLPLDFRQNVFLMFKESLANIVKHSQATCVHIEVLENEQVWQLTIRDNGIGFDMANVNGGNGLKNLQRRAEKLKGTLKIESRAGGGTSICFSTKCFK